MVNEVFLIGECAPPGAPRTVRAVGGVNGAVSIGYVLRPAQVHVAEAVAAHAHVVYVRDKVWIIDVITPSDRGVGFVLK